MSKKLKKQFLKEGTITYEKDSYFYIDEVSSNKFRLIKSLSTPISFIDDCDNEVDYYIEEQFGVDLEYKIYFKDKGKKIYLTPTFEDGTERVFNSKIDADTYIGIIDQDCTVYVRQMWFVEDGEGNRFRKEIVATSNRWHYEYERNFSALNYEIPDHDELLIDFTFGEEE